VGVTIQTAEREILVSA
jgi:phosphatidylserine/phosphatidylglycerophosphate/cardiolipin synthase-like enzyme